MAKEARVVNMGRGPGRGPALEKPKNPKETIGRLAKYLMAYKGQMLLSLIHIYAFTAITASALPRTGTATDVTNTQNSFANIIRGMIRGPLMLICAVIMAVSINAQLSLIFLVAVPVLGSALAVIAVKAYPRFQRMLDPVSYTHLQRLKEAAEKAKIELSGMTTASINLPFITADATGPKHLDMTLTRAKFNELTHDLVEATMGPVRQALSDSGLKVSELNKILLVGGSSRIPAVQEAVKSFTGKDPFKGINPDECVAIGAAIQGGVLGGEVKGLLLLDVTPL